MFYIKKEISKGVIIHVDITGENVYTKCEECGKEIEFDPTELEDICLYTTRVTCESCYKKRKE